ncbi:MAG: D-glycero-alpha-D-manno-heptose-7-phosphate kinase [Verrucomicrobia bacterium]|nr:MAG: D-glycero-alpha-D-manno-heptose-7-phosphate kinase [Verrucomicrobiota bacterium]
MIITRTPFRITLGGGGTDLPSFYEQHGGFVFTMAINKYMFICLNKRSVADKKIVIRYSQVETVDSLSEIKHPLAREALKLHGLNENIELTSIADMPGKAGLGSSGAYLVGLLTAIRAYKNQSASAHTIAEEACHIEMNLLKEPVGKQDQYIAALGGFQVLEIDKGGRVQTRAVPVDFVTANELAAKCRVYYTGVQRSATAILREQDSAAKAGGGADKNAVIETLLAIKEIGARIEHAFLDRDLDAFARLTDEHWQQKRRLAPGVSISSVDELYDVVKKRFGVLGGKIIGAGGGGFLMLYTPHPGRELDEFMAGHDMPRVSYFPSAQGSRVASDLTTFDDFGG